jgi:hypothetical protein
MHSPASGPASACRLLQVIERKIEHGSTLVERTELPAQGLETGPREEARIDPRTGARCVLRMAARFACAFWIPLSCSPVVPLQLKLEDSIRAPGR